LLQLKAKRKTEEPCTVVLYAGFCEGIGGVIRHSISIVRDGKNIYILVSIYRNNYLSLSKINS